MGEGVYFFFFREDFFLAAFFLDDFLFTVFFLEPLLQGIIFFALLCLYSFTFVKHF